MGSIRRHDIGSLIEKYELKNYIETGTGIGDCLSFAMEHQFTQIHSIEIYEQIYNDAKEKFSADNLTLHNGNSYEKLPQILKVTEGNTLFFLDAHFPGVDFHFESFGSETDKDKSLPLEQELKTIKENFNTEGSIFIIDDLRIYEDGPFTGGNWSERRLYGGDGIEFIYDLFDSTHEITKDYSDQGYIIITPKK
jgi:hypothetical protein